MSEQSSASRARFDRPSWVSVDPSKDEKRRPPLSRPRIVRAALRLVDEQGLAALTMRALAHQLEVSPMALYNHVRDKDELADLMLDLMLGEVDLSATEGDWVTQLRALVCSYHEVLSAHPGLARVYSKQVKIGPHGLLIIERGLRILLEAGLSPPEAADAFLSLYTYTVGYHQIGRIVPLPGSSAHDETGGYYSALPAEQIPSVLAVGPHLTGVHRPGGFEYGLDTLLTGLQTGLATARADRQLNDEQRQPRQHQQGD